MIILLFRSKKTKVEFHTPADIIKFIFELDDDIGVPVAADSVYYVDFREYEYVKWLTGFLWFERFLQDMIDKYLRFFRWTGLDFSILTTDRRQDLLKVYRKFSQSPQHNPPIIRLGGYEFISLVAAIAEFPGRCAIYEAYFPPNFKVNDVVIQEKVDFYLEEFSEDGYIVKHRIADNYNFDIVNNLLTLGDEFKKKQTEELLGNSSG